MKLAKSTENHINQWKIVVSIVRLFLLLCVIFPLLRAHSVEKSDDSDVFPSEETVKTRKRREKTISDDK